MSELGDMPTEEFRREARAVIDWLCDVFDHPDRFPVLSRVRPGEVAGAIPAEVPEDSTPMTEILERFTTGIVPGITHWNHPGFFAYFAISSSGPGILGELLAAGLNVNAMLWRTSPAATELEERTVDWLRGMLGLPNVFHGHLEDTASTSTLVAMASAREAIGIDATAGGLAGRDLPPLRVYCSDQAHFSVDRAAMILGLGRSGVRRIPTDGEYRMRADALDAAIEEDLSAGVHPVCVVATIGTTSTTSVDPVGEIADVCARHRLWLHVDAAYGGAAAILPEMRTLVAGWERADSIVVNPHKWLFVPIDCSALLLRRPEITRRAFALRPEYLMDGEEGITNLMDYGPALGRRFRSLKLWMTLSYFGRLGIAARIREHLRLANAFAGWVSRSPGWELAAPVPFSTVCFRAIGNDDGEATDLRNQRILERVNASGEAFLSSTRLRGRLVLRLAIGNLRTTEEHVARAWLLLQAAADE